MMNKTTTTAMSDLDKEVQQFSENLIFFIVKQHKPETFTRSRRHFWTIVV